jgi:hypothetical protein
MRRVRLTEGQLHNVIIESVGRILNEISKDKKMMSMKKARDLGRNDQANEFAESLLDDLKPYEYRNMPTEGFFGYDRKNCNGLKLQDSRCHNGIDNYHVDRPDASKDYYHHYYGDWYEDEFPDGDKYYDFNKERNADPRYIKAKTELDRLNGLKYK